jgi:tetratricopeptide (TPR) repeat protein
VKKLLFLCFLILPLVAKETQLYESGPNVIFHYDHLSKKEKEIALQVDFNNAVFYLEQEQYLKAIKLFKRTATILKVPSFLNIGIAYYKLNSINNAYLYLKKIYDIKEAANFDTYSYLSASYYLYQITKDRKYITTIVDTVKDMKSKDVSEHVKRLLADTYIMLKDYKKAIKVIELMKTQNNLKLGLLYLKVKEYDKSDIYLTKAYEETRDDQLINKILWFKVFRDLKANSIGRIIENIDMIQTRRKVFEAHQEMPLKIYFNPDKYDAKEYFERVTKFSQSRKIDMIFYFAPFIFIDNREIANDATLGFVLKNSTNIESLDMMVDYNKKFIAIVKDDPIIRAKKLQKMVDAKYDTKAYEYYNLALSYAQIDDFLLAHKYFKKAYDLNRANKLYSAMTLISAKRADKKLHPKLEKKIIANLVSKKGTYKYLGKYIYKIIYDNKYDLDTKVLSKTARKSIFLRALHFLENVNEKGFRKEDALLAADVKDPLVFLLRSLIKGDNESDYDYVSRLQDSIPKNYNDYFLKGPLIVTQYYIDLLKAVGIFNRVRFNIKGDTTPTYLRTKALVMLYDGFPIRGIKILEKLQEDYNLNDKYTSNLLIASFLSANDYSNASATLGMLQFELKDNDAKFLNGVQLLQSMKLNSAKQSFTKQYKGFLIDFKMEGFDKFLESL